MRHLLTLLVVGIAAAAWDTDGDGAADWHGPALVDADNDGSFDRLPSAGSAALFSDSISFSRAWTSGSSLNNQWDGYCGYLDGDSLLDLLGHHWNPNVLHVFESDGSGGYDHVWEQTESLPPGSYCTVTAGDPDDDGDIEILGGEVSTLGKVVIFENVGDDSWAHPAVPIRLRNERIRTVRVADTDRDDTNEIVVICGDASDGGGVYIYEHSGPPGVHSYVERYHYETVSYLFQGEVGDADNDGYPEVLIGVGGWHGFPMYIRRIVYDSTNRSYSHHMFEAPVIGLHLTPSACDLDSDGDNEYVVGSSGDPSGQLQIMEYAGGDSFRPLWTSAMTTSGNVIAAAAARFEDVTHPFVFAAPFGGAVYGFARDDSAWHGVSYFNPGTGAAIRSIDAGRDGRDQLLLAESAPADYLSVWRREPGQALVGEPTSAFRTTRAATLVSAALRFSSPAQPGWLVNAAGARLKRLQPGANDIRALPAGAYFVVAGGAAPRPVIVVRP